MCKLDKEACETGSGVTALHAGYCAGKYLIEFCVCLFILYQGSYSEGNLSTPLFPHIAIQSV